MYHRFPYDRHHQSRAQALGLLSASILRVEADALMGFAAVKERWQPPLIFNSSPNAFRRHVEDRYTDILYRVIAVIDGPQQT